MAHDALDQSRSAAGPSLERQVRDLQAILGHLLNRVQQCDEKVNGNRARIDRTAAMAASASARAELGIELARQAAPALEVLRRVADEAEKDEGPRHAEPAPKRDRHGMHIVHGAGGLGAAAALLAFAKSPLARGTHRAVSMALMAAVGAGATVAGPSLLMPSPSPAHSATVPVRHHHQGARTGAGAVSPPTAPAPVRHGRRHHRHAAAAVAAPAPSPAVSPLPSTAPPAPVPAPSPAATVPLPLPSTAPPDCDGDCQQVLKPLLRSLPLRLPQWQH